MGGLFGVDQGLGLVAEHIICGKCHLSLKGWCLFCKEESWAPASMPSRKRLGVPGKGSLPGTYGHPPAHILMGQPMQAFQSGMPMMGHPVSLGQLAGTGYNPSNFGASSTRAPTNSDLDLLFRVYYIRTKEK